MTSPTRVVFLGSGGFAVPILDALGASPGVRLVGVVSTPPRPAGRAAELRPTPVATRAGDLGVPLLLPARLRDAESLAAIAGLQPDLLVLADYGRIVPQTLLDMAPHGALNLHPSLLPRHRGATPIPAAILSGDAETGVSLIRMDAGIDTGPLVAQRRLPLSGDEDTPGLETRLSSEAARLLMDAMPAWLDGTLPAIPQSADGASSTRPFRREDGLLDPTRAALGLDRQVRAMRPWPGTYLERTDGRILVWATRPLDVPRPADVSPGDLILHGRELALVTGEGLLELTEVQPAGGKRMRGADLARGRVGLLSVARDASPADTGVQR